MKLKSILSTFTICTAALCAEGNYGLEKDRVVEEAGSLAASKDAFWWLNSGAYFYISNRVGRTVSGELPTENRWYRLYKRSNPADTESGRYPQHVFRLISKKTFEESEQTAYFRIKDYRKTESPNRDAHNGILLLARYKDSSTFYYAGVRVDGKAVIKKKMAGAYETLATKPVYAGPFDRTNKPNLLPEDQWFGIRATIRDTAEGVSIELAVAKGEEEWEQVLTIIDPEADAPLKGSGAVGIRSDFMDLEVQNYSLKEF